MMGFLISSKINKDKEEKRKLESYCNDFGMGHKIVKDKRYSIQTHYCFNKTEPDSKFIIYVYTIRSEEGAKTTISRGIVK